MERHKKKRHPWKQQQAIDLSSAGNLHMINSRFFIQNLAGQRGVGWYIQSAERKKYQPRILYPEKLSSKNEGELESLPNKQKLREFITTTSTL